MVQNGENNEGALFETSGQKIMLDLIASGSVVNSLPVKLSLSAGIVLDVLVLIHKYSSRKIGIK